MRAVAVLAGVVLLAASCGGEPVADRPASRGAETVTSEDGGLTVGIPSGALRTGEEIEVRTLGPDEAPPELGDLQARGILRGTLYDLEPEGTTFGEPVTVTQRIDVGTAGLDVSAGVPVVLLAARDAGGKWAFLDNQSIALEGATLVVGGTTTHFSTIAALGGVVSVGVRPRTIEEAVGSTWTSAVVTGAADANRGEAPAVLGSVRGRVGSGGVVSVGASADGRQSFVCSAPGTGEFFVDVSFSEILRGRASALLIPELGLVRPVRVVVGVAGEATCTQGAAPAPTASPTAEPTPTAEAQLALESGRVCLEKVPFAGFASSEEWTMAFGPAEELTPGAKLTLTLDDGGRERVAQATIASDGSAGLRIGTDPAVQKRIVSATVTSADGATNDVTDGFVEVFGAAHVGTDAGGLVAGAGACPAP